MSTLLLIELILTPRTVSKAEGARVATQHDCSFHETTAAEDYESVQAAFHSLIREIARVKERQMPQCRLFISEDNREAPSPSGQVRLKSAPKDIWNDSTYGLRI